MIESAHLQSQIKCSINKYDADYICIIVITEKYLLSIIIRKRISYQHTFFVLMKTK